jgi:hypothetical protein
MTKYYFISLKYLISFAKKIDRFPFMHQRGKTVEMCALNLSPKITVRVYTQKFHSLFQINSRNQVNQSIKY